MLRRFAAAFVLVVLGLVPLLGGGVAAADQSAWNATATQAIPLANATDNGQLTSSSPIQISVAMELQNQSQLDSYITNVSTPGSPNYGQSLTPAQFKSQYSPTPSQVQAVENYLSSQGFTNLSVASNNIYVTGSATPAEADSAFDTEIDTFTQNGSTVFANVKPAMVPASLGGEVTSVLGLTNANRMQFPTGGKSDTNDTPSTNVPNSFWAPGFQQAYDATGTAPASQTSIAIMAEGDVSQVVTDLRDYENDPNNNLPQVPVTVVQVGPPSSDTSGLVEFDMDTQTSTGLAGDVQRLYIYDATSLVDSDVALELNTFASQDVAKAGSASFGECEYAAYLDGFMVANDETLSEAAAQGQTLFASAGDSGGFCAVNGLANGVPGGEPDVNYPASSPYVVAVGGTTLVTNTDGSYGEELAWDAGGGGVSYFEYQSEWQSGVAPPTGSTCVAQSPVCLGKDVPDIAMDADFLLSAANFYNAGATTSNGGTSLASPLALGSWARIETAKDNSIGFASPSLYAAAGTAGFHDVTLGDNGPYPALPGWDFATGNGSFDIAQMINVIGATTPTPSFPAVPPPTCNEYYGDGTANPIGSTSNNDALSIEAGGFSTNVADKTLTAVLRVKSLNDGPGGLPDISGSGDQWYAEFSYQPTASASPTTYFLSAAYDGSTAATTQNPYGFVLGYGHLTQSTTGGADFSPDGTASGQVDLANGLISITAPWSDFGSQLSPAVATPVVYDNLAHLGAASYEEVGTNSTGGLLESADSAGGTGTYMVGKNCTPASVTIDPSSLNQTYGGTGATVTASTDPTGLTYAVMYNGSVTPPTQPGTYSVVVSVTDLNYVGTASGTLTVSPAPLQITASGSTTTYGQAPAAITPTYSGFVNGDSASTLIAQPACETMATASSNAGAYSSSCSGASSPDYDITYVDGQVTVNQEPLKVTAGSSNITFGQAIPALSQSYQGFVLGQNSSALATAPSCSAAATSTSSAGVYPTSCSGGASANYSLSYVPGTLTVDLARPAIAYTGKAKLKDKAKAMVSAKMTSSVTAGTVAGRSLTFALGTGSNKRTCAAVTGSTGVATCSLGKISGKKGTRTLTVSFAGDAHGAAYDYSAASTHEAIKIA